MNQNLLRWKTMPPDSFNLSKSMPLPSRKPRIVNILTSGFIGLLIVSSLSCRSGIKSTYYQACFFKVELLLLRQYWVMNLKALRQKFGESQKVKHQNCVAWLHIKVFYLTLVDCLTEITSRLRCQKQLAIFKRTMIARSVYWNKLYLPC